MMDPKAWWEQRTFWIPTLFSLVGCFLGLLGYFGSRHAAMIAEHMAEVSLQPKLFVGTVTLNRSPLFPSSSLVSYTIQNRGTTALSNVKAYAGYKVFGGKTAEDKAPLVNQSNAPSATIEAGDQVEQTLFINAGTDLDPRPNYDLLLSANQGLVVQINLTADGDRDTRAVLCEKFFFNPHIGRFERARDCKAIDWDSVPVRGTVTLNAPTNDLWLRLIGDLDACDLRRRSTP